MAAGHSIDPACWQKAFEVLMGRIAGRFVRVEPRRRARAFVLGLLSDMPRKNCWTLAEQAGDANPYGLQHLLSRAKWDADAVRDDIRGFVVEHLHHEDAVLVVVETGDLKKRTGTEDWLRPVPPPTCGPIRPQGVRLRQEEAEDAEADGWPSRVVPSQCRQLGWPGLIGKCWSACAALNCVASRIWSCGRGR
ncbi:hypothetical protein M878_44310 [Streptomyces roseochromogenus subsp. oscitans DS 12.976]|uniref:Transposase IS701-like DDE domain-containing protein n=1 Tax=Streptomyces roseochromogenus subsp. oscitans DS 12.976 TaxID=1352936 RepID=V6JGV6_STRRC|nr:hypothetical protein M878_44310 [Streptomyces roseochromogenus subsp. oscitans DS 12.976]